MSLTDSVTTESNKATTLMGVEQIAKASISNKTNGKMSVLNTHDETSRDTATKKKKKGIFGKKKTKYEQEGTSLVSRNYFRAGQQVIFDAVSTNTLQTPEIHSGGKTIIRSRLGRVYMAGDKDFQMFQLQKGGKSVFWQSQQNKGANHEKAHMAHINAKGGVDIFGAQGVSIDISQSFHQLEKDPKTAWVKAFRHNPAVHFKLIEEEHKKWNKKSQGMTPAASALIAIAVLMVTFYAMLASI